MFGPGSFDQHITARKGHRDDKTTRLDPVGDNSVPDTMQGFHALHLNDRPAGAFNSRAHRIECTR
jgi:hypothetical protein